MKARPALFEGEGEEGVSQKMRQCYSILHSHLVLKLLLVEKKVMGSSMVKMNIHL